MRPWLATDASRNRSDLAAAAPLEALPPERRLPLTEYAALHACDSERHHASVEHSLSHWDHIGAAELDAAIDAAAQWNATVLIAIRDNQLYADVSSLVAGRHYWAQLSNQLLELLELVEVDDCHFVMSLNDGAVVSLHERADTNSGRGGSAGGAPLPALLSLTGSAEHADILAPGPHLLEWARPQPVFLDDVGAGDVELGVWAREAWHVDAVPWERKAPRLFWRGTNSAARRRASGARECAGDSFATCTARARLVAAARAAPDAIDAGFSSFTAREPCLCGSPYDEVKAATARPHEPMEAQHAHKYLASVDGYTAAWRLARLLSLGSLVLKQESHYEEYWYRWLRPWQHYVPMAEDVTSDLHARLAWARAHDDEARGIAAAGRRLVRAALRQEELRCYWARLLRGYAARQRAAPARRGGDGVGGARAQAASAAPPAAFARVYEHPVRTDAFVCEQLGAYGDCE